MRPSRCHGAGRSRRRRGVGARCSTGIAGAVWADGAAWSAVSCWWARRCHRRPRRCVPSDVDVDVVVEVELRDVVESLRVVGCEVVDAACCGAAGAGEYTVDEDGADCACTGAAVAAGAVGAGEAATRRLTVVRRTRSIARCRAAGRARCTAAVAATPGRRVIAGVKLTGVASIAVARAGACWTRLGGAARAVSPPPPGVTRAQVPGKTMNPVSTMPRATARAVSASAVPAPRASSRRNPRGGGAKTMRDIHVQVSRHGAARLDPFVRPGRVRRATDVSRSG